MRLVVSLFVSIILKSPKKKINVKVAQDVRETKDLFSELPEFPQNPC
jgi:hypothetical protein